MVQLFAAPPRQSKDPVIPQDKPVYRNLDEKGFFGPDDTLHCEANGNNIFVLWDAPNENMEPLNEMARERFETYIDSLEKSAKEVADKNGRHFAGRPRTKEEMIANASEDARRIQTVGNAKGLPVMGAKKDSSNRIQSVGQKADVPDLGAATVKVRAKIENVG